MTKTGGSDAQAVVRLPNALLKRADALRAKVAKDADSVAFGGRISRSTVLRLAIVRGLEALEKDYA
jgi:hypothetical protein